MTTRRLAAILAADVAGYSRLMAVDEAGTLARFNALRSEVFDPKFAQYQGRVVGSAGDSLLVEFASAVDAVQCAVEAQARVAERNAGMPEDRHMVFRMGVNLGDVIAEGGTIHGDGVNVASRLERLAEPGRVVVARAIRDQVKGKLPYAFLDMGEHQVKNIDEPVRAFAVQTEALPAHRQAKAKEPLHRTKPSVAVLPFANMSGDPELQHLGDGLAEDIITSLARNRAVAVVARNSSFAFRGQALDLRRVGEDLAADYVLEGSVRKMGSAVRLTAQLIDAPSGIHIWADRFDLAPGASAADVDEIVATAVGQMTYDLVDGYAARQAGADDARLSAHAHYLRGRMLWRAGDDAAAGAAFEKAIAIDPLFGPALAMIGYFHTLSLYTGRYDLPEETVLERGRHYAERAAKSAETDTMMYVVLSTTYADLGEMDRALALVNLGLQLSPHDVDLRCQQGYLLVFAGQHAKGLEIFEKAIALVPKYPSEHREGLIENLFTAREYERAVAEYHRMTDAPLYVELIHAMCLASLGRSTEAARALAAFRKHQGRFDVGVLARCYVRLCRLPEDKEHWLAGFRGAGFDV